MVFNLAELFENQFQVVGGDAQAGVGDAELDGVLGRQADRADGDGAGLGEFQRVRDEVAQDLRQFRLIGEHQASALGRAEAQAQLFRHQQRAQHAAQRAEHIGHVEADRAHFHLAGLDLGQVEQVIHQVVQRDRSLQDEVDLLVLFGRQLAVDPVQQQLRERADRAQRGAEFVAHIRQEARLHLVGAAQVVGFFIQLGVQGNHAAVGVFQFARQFQQFLLARLQLGQRGHQFLVLQLHFKQGGIRRQRAQLVTQRADHLRRQYLGVAREQFLQHNIGTVARAALALVLVRLGLDVDPVHQAPRAEDAEAHAGGRVVSPGQDAVQLGDAGAAVAYAHQQDLGRGRAFNGKLDHAVAGVIVDIARQLGNRGRDAHLVLAAEAAQRGHLARALARGDDVEFGLDGNAEDA